PVRFEGSAFLSFGFAATSVYVSWGRSSKWVASLKRSASNARSISRSSSISTGGALGAGLGLVDILAMRSKAGAFWLSHFGEPGIPSPGLILRLQAAMIKVLRE